MKHDPELIRRILEEAELKLPTDLLEFEGYTEEQVHRHIELLHDAGLIRAHLVNSEMQAYPLVARVQKITAEGYHFLDTARQPRVWKAVMKRVAGAGGSVGVTMLVEWLKREAFGSDG